MDLIGPRIIEIRDKWYEFSALTSIDLVTNLVELIRVDRKTSAKIRSKLEQSWLARYPWPKRCIYDNGESLLADNFKNLPRKTSIKDVPTTSWNPQVNAIREIMHHTVGNVLCVLP